MSYDTGTELGIVAMNERQWHAIEWLQSEYPEPMVVGWSAQPGGEVRGHVLRDVEHDQELSDLAADGKPWEWRALGVFTICTTGTLRWIGPKPASVPGTAPEETME